MVFDELIVSSNKPSSKQLDHFYPIEEYGGKGDVVERNVKKLEWACLSMEDILSPMEVLDMDGESYEFIANLIPDIFASMFGEM